MTYMWPVWCLRMFLYSWLQQQVHCFARVIVETCNTSAADINLLKTVLYNAKLSQVVSSSCILGELPSARGQ